MPDFSIETWTSFKNQFISVIQFLYYCFDMVFDGFRSNPMLYIGLFFPIFALAFIAVFDFLLHMTHPGGLSVGTNNIGLSSGFHGYSKSVSGIHSRNLAASGESVKGSSGSSVNGSAGESVKGSSGSSVKGSSGSAVNASTGSSSINSSSRGVGSLAFNIFGNIVDSYKKRRSDKLARKEQDALIYEQIEAEQEKLAYQHKQDFDTKVFRDHWTDDEGHRITDVTTEVDGEVVSDKVYIDTYFD